MDRTRFDALALNLGVPAEIVPALWDALHTTGGLSRSVPPIDSGRTFHPDSLAEEPQRTDSTSPTDSALGSRYTDLGHLGEGGAGEVRRVLDTELNRVVAMKTCLLYTSPSPRD